MTDYRLAAMRAWVLVLASLMGAADPASASGPSSGPSPDRSESVLARAGIEVTEVDAVDPLEAAVLVDELARAVERAARAEAIVVGTAAAPCPIGSPRCARVIPDLVEARVVVRIFGGLSMVRIDAVATGSKIASTRSSVDVPRDGELARAGLAELAHTLFPERLVALAAPVTARPPDPALATATELPPPVDEGGDVAWLVVGGGSAVLLAAVGTGFGLSSAAARDAAETPGVDSARFDSLADRAQAHGWAANVFFVTAALGLAAGVVLYAVEP